jgi:hypothetical protein
LDRVGFIPEMKPMSRRPLPTALDIDLRGGLTDLVTPHAGVALLIELGRRSGAIPAADRQLPPKKSVQGLEHSQFVEAFVVLSAVGGECVDDCAPWRPDRDLAALLGYDLPAAATARQSLARFHDKTRLAGRPTQGSFLPDESTCLLGLQALVQRTVHA